MKHNGFTLIEILVALAIISILATAGVFTYNGYTTAAKKNVSKIIHSKTVRFLSAEVALCSLLDDSTIMKKRISCGYQEGNWNGCDSNDCKAQMIIDELDVFEDENPYDNSEPAVTAMELGLGYTVVYNREDHLEIKTQWDKDDSVSPLVNYIYFDGTTVAMTGTTDPGGSTEKPDPNESEPTTGRPNQTFETYKPPVIPGVFGEECPRKPEAELTERQKKNKWLAQEKFGCNFGAWLLVDSEGIPVGPKLQEYMPYSCSSKSPGGGTYVTIDGKHQRNPKKPLCWSIIIGGTGVLDPELADTRYPLIGDDEKKPHMLKFFEEHNMRMVLVNPLTNYFGEEDRDGDGKTDPYKQGEIMEDGRSIRGNYLMDRETWKNDSFRQYRYRVHGDLGWTSYSCQNVKRCRYDFETKIWSTTESEIKHTDTGRGVKCEKPILSDDERSMTMKCFNCTWKVGTTGEIEYEKACQPGSSMDAPWDQYTY